MRRWTLCDDAAMRPRRRCNMLRSGSPCRRQTGIVPACGSGRPAAIDDVVGCRIGSPRANPRIGEVAKRRDLIARGSQVYIARGATGQKVDRRRSYSEGGHQLSRDHVGSRWTETQLFIDHDAVEINEQQTADGMRNQRRTELERFLYVGRAPSKPEQQARADSDQPVS